MALFKDYIKKLTQQFKKGISYLSFFPIKKKRWIWEPATEKVDHFCQRLNLLEREPILFGAHNPKHLPLLEEVKGFMNNQKELASNCRDFHLLKQRILALEYCLELHSLTLSRAIFDILKKEASHWKESQSLLPIK
ncbi:hypothetical protein PHSC3_001079 [Chlamydiales bacterium STE3]|nr:hypothetical protein PHSC3_001079 [Chlamydiales bacterium STE3]